ncbi:hypothetical protein SPRG_19391 [Saprolegnia parasitica CBS 223.65]|uniref:Uncharacterized protein n=1 Tax=Saprolegnia parasitica (strain CBS 223.65) TaxID=695850 RepID=A0A067D2H8_SAPPC|nr:hypothetical protein SPRG_19391 [Saprolegnia parasitica CBS 223.65]KDO33212.1 hypothetical protein SPRG_19391 [Saprolegnia parasitica CBS 223.65]|eukprot:XP_012196271.1 hypothetical protein SPRG_19391 [Saprolegnia parasitica CBS 223.65]
MRVSDLTGPARKRMIDRLYTTIRVAGEALEALEIHSKTTLFNTTNFSERMYLHGATAYRVVDVLGKKNVEANKIFTYAAGAMRCDGPGVDGEDLLKIMSAHYAKKLVDTLNVLLSEARLERVDAMPWTALEEGTIAGHSLSLGGWPTFVALKAEAPPVHCKIIKKLLKADQIKFELGPLVQQ